MLGVAGASLVHTMNPAQGTLDRHGRYRLVHEVGRGKYALAYQAVDTHTKEVVVVKCLALTRLSEDTRAHLSKYLEREVDNHR